MKLLESNTLLELSYVQKKEKTEIVPYPEDIKAYKAAKKRFDKGEYTNIEDLKKMFYEKYPKKNVQNKNR